MKNFLLADSIISPLGFGTEANLENLRNSKSALQLQPANNRFPNGYYAGIIDEDVLDVNFEKIGKISSLTKLEKMMILAIQDVLNSSAIDLENLGLVMATTKGNIDLITSNNFEGDRVQLWKLGEVIASFFKIKSKPIIVSNACISGGLAVKVANDLIRAGKCKHALVVAGDLVSEFVMAGFQSFQAISPFPCRPFSNDRAGISLGEAAAALLIGPKANSHSNIQYVNVCTANDANHISGPSRNGEGLVQAVSRVLENSNLKSDCLDYISAHGTATIYNDEMEAIAFNRLGLQEVPLNSFKGYYGHTLGASALIETILTKHALQNNELLKSLNYTAAGVSKSLKIIKENFKTDLKLALNTASGFGGCNLAMLLKKEI
ncbi:beta-ketoacyl synthase N-terminal-like domain-containing protein [Gramella sp. AN32]|uniref:Beta-ketoacyl synthase N-terminal-like domain-containing protein n=1 Tax=Christiangramia antarctica TaxID=2058158 RepID=A0ABW5WZ72_9FLAO|nr:beta-ketoacyl synthase N-terminal-like domain-containing protein [Gramella sp. AN32]MCM4156758.1 beta-ketoacyl synthase [Gramella sp. AN32]